MKFSKYNSKYSLLSCLTLILLSILLFPEKTFAVQGTPNIYYIEEENTIYVKNTQAATETIIELPDIATAINNESLLKEEAPGIWILKANLWIKGSENDEKKITLQLTNETVSWLKLKSDSQGFIWIKGYNANIVIRDTKITSWDENIESYDTNYSDGRSFILAKYNSKMDIINSELAYLGYHSGESYGVSWRIKKGSKGQYIVTGEVINSKFHHNYYGVYSYGAEAMVFRNNEFYENIQYGFDPHDDSNNFLVEGNIAYNNGSHGIIFSKRCINNTIRNNISYNNTLSGIMLDKQSNNNIVENNITYGNINGIAIYGSEGNNIINNKVYQNQRGILLKDYSSDNTVEDNQIYENTQYGIYLYNGATENTILNNEIYSNVKAGVYIKSDKNIIGPNNSIYSNEKGVSLYKDNANNNTIKENNIFENKYGIALKIASQNKIYGNEIHHNDKYGVYLYSVSEENKISENNIYSNYRGIYLKESNNNEINSNIVKSNESYGIYLYKSSFNTISDNTVEENERGIYLKEQTSNNILEGNSICHNIKEGLYLNCSNENNINNNIIESNNSYGIYLYKASNGNAISGNSLEKNKKGIYIKLSNENKINQNSIKLNADYAIYLYDAQNNTFTGNIVLDNGRNYYYAKFRANNTIQDTDSMAVKIRDNESSMNIIDTKNYIFQNNKKLATVAEPAQTSILLTRTITSAVVSFKRLNFKVIPALNQISVTPQIWEISSDYYKKWTELPFESSVIVEHIIGDLKPNTDYDIFVNNEFLNTYTSDQEGYIEFIYNNEDTLEKTFELREK